MGEKLSFAIDNIELLEESNNSQFATLKIDVFASGDNRHDLYVSDDTLRSTAHSILQKPIVWDYSPLTDDATTHTDTQTIVGFIPHDSPLEFNELADGRIMLTVIGKLWTKYCGKMFEIFQRDKEKSVSVELEVLEYSEDEEKPSKLKELLNYCFQAITVLGQNVTPAIPGAKADLLAFAVKEKQEYERAYRKEFSDKYYDIDFTIPETIKKSAKKALDYYKSSGEAANSAHLSMGRFLIKNDKITPEKIRAMSSFFKRKVNYSDFILGLYGSQEGARWSKEMEDKLNEIDNKQISYYSDDILTFPYKSIGDINPALKGISPPVSLGQANEIARQADAIGGEYGWPTAISSFKKRHHVEKGKWVKNKTEKEEESFMKDEKDLEKKEEMAEEKLPESEEKPKEEMAENKDEEKKETPEEEKKESPEEEKKEKEEGAEEKMSNDANLDIAAMLAMLDNQTEAYAKLAKQHEDGNVDFAVLCSEMYSKMCKMAEDLKKSQENNEAYMAKNKELEEYKMSEEEKKFNFGVASVLEEASESGMPKDKIEERREKSKEFSLNTFDAWKNETLALAFSYAKDKKGKKDDDIVKIDLGFVAKNDERDLSHGWVK